MRRRPGTTLLETILSIAVLALAISVFFNLYPTSALGIRKAEHRLIADNLAHGLLESQRARPFDELTPSPETPLATHTGSDGVVFQPSLAIERTPLTAQLRVRVRWSHYRQTQEITYAIYVSKIH